MCCERLKYIHVPCSRSNNVESVMFSDDTLTYDLCIQQLTEDTANGWNIAVARRVETE